MGKEKEQGRPFVVATYRYLSCQRTVGKVNRKTLFYIGQDKSQSVPHLNLLQAFHNCYQVVWCNNVIHKSCKMHLNGFYIFEG